MPKKPARKASKPRKAAPRNSPARRAAAAPRPLGDEAFRPPAYQRGNFGMPKRMCPFCNSTDVSPDSMGGDIMSWTCKSCGNSFPAPLEAKGGKCGPNGEDSEYEEMPE